MKRYVDNGRGLHPLYPSNDSGARFWPMDNDNSVNVNGYHGISSASNNLTPMNGSTPTIIDTIIGKGRNLDGGAMEAQTNADIRTLITNGTFQFSAWIRVNTLPATGRGALFGVWGDNAVVSAAESGLFLLGVKASGELEHIWENNGATIGAGWTPTDVFIQEGVWHKIDFIGSSGVGANFTARMYLDGQIRYNPGTLPKASGGSSSSRFVIGGINESGSNILGLDVDFAGFYFFGSGEIESQVITSYKRGALIGQGFETRPDVQIENQSGSAYVSMSDYIGEDMLIGFETSEDVDTTTQLATVSVKKEIGLTSSSPLRTDSEFNLTNKVDPASYSALIRKGAGIKIRTALTPYGIAPVDADYMEIFDGEIITASFSSDPISITCADGSRKFVQSFIESDYNYGGPFKTVSGADVSPLVSEPIGDVMQEILNDNDNVAQSADKPALYGSYDPVTLFVADNPDFEILEYKQRREPVLSALTTLASQIGWLIRWKFDNTTQSWRLTFYNPDPDFTPAGGVFEYNDVLDISSAEMDTENIRNSVKVIYASKEDYTSGSPPDINSELPIPGDWIATNGNSGPDTHGNRTPAFVSIENRTSIDKYGRAHSEISEDASSQIDTVIEAGRLATTFIRSMSEPNFSYTFTVPYFPAATIGERVHFYGGTSEFSDNQLLNVVGLSHKFSDGLANTTLTLRGTPATGYKKWLGLEVRPGLGRPGTALGDESLGDRRLGDLLSSNRFAFENSDQFTGGKYLAVRNSNFQLMTRGDRYTPDGWRDGTGALWGTSIVPDRDNSFSGTQAIRFDTGTSPITLLSGSRRGLISDLVPVPGGSTPYSFECSWKYVTPGANMGLDVVLEWYEGDRMTQTGTTILEFDDDNGLGDNVWITSRIDGVSPPTAATRWLRIIVGISLAATQACYVDNITGYKTSRSAKVYIDELAFPDGSASLPYQAGETTLVPLNQTGDVPAHPFFLPDGASGYDYGDNFVENYSSFTPSSEPLNYFEVLEDGTYDVTFRQVVVDVDGINSASNYIMVAIKNGDYSLASPTDLRQTHVDGTGEIVEMKPSVDAGNNGFMLGGSFSVQLRQGDQLTINALNSGSGLLAQSLTRGGSFATFKLRLAE